MPKAIPAALELLLALSIKVHRAYHRPSSHRKQHPAYPSSVTAPKPGKPVNHGAFRVDFSSISKQYQCQQAEATWGSAPRRFSHYFGVMQLFLAGGFVAAPGQHKRGFSTVNSRHSVLQVLCRFISWYTLLFVYLQ